jgi:hypothetical protein
MRGGPRVIALATIVILAVTVTLAVTAWNRLKGKDMPEPWPDEPGGDSYDSSLWPEPPEHDTLRELREC